MTRTERDLIGTKEIPDDALYGIHTLRAFNNFTVSGRTLNCDFIKALATVKIASAKTNMEIETDRDNIEKWQAIVDALEQIEAGHHDGEFIIDALSGGAGTSANMNINEVAANLALVKLGRKKGDYNVISPLNFLNLHQSTNDVFPTALKLAAIFKLKILEQNVVSLQEAFQRKEKEFAHVVKVARTELQDAVLTTVGRQMSAYSDVLSRDRWRIYKCEERLRVINLGGTAIGSGIGAPREYIFKVSDMLRNLTGIGFARSENMIDNTQNADVFVEVSGILKALAVTIAKISGDLRILSSGPDAGIGEIILEPRQAGSSLMPGKINPVIPEAAAQGAMEVMGNDAVIAMAAASGNLELNQFMPLIGDKLLSSLDILINIVKILDTNCIQSLGVDIDVCKKHVDSKTAIATALVSRLGYDTVSELIRQSEVTGERLKDLAVKNTFITYKEIEALITPEAVCRLGSR